MTESNSIFRRLPSVDALLQQDGFQVLLRRYPRPRVVRQAQLSLSALRAQIQAGMDEATLAVHLSEVARTVRQALEESTTPTLRRVINASGVVIHTNLGRAPIAGAAVDFLRGVVTGYCNLEYDLETGRRSHREKHLEPLLQQLTGRDAGVAVVNNNAAAVLLILDTFASGGEVVVSRGELVEIGGSFRIPEILEKSGATLREVGTTNKTRTEDYARAIGKNTRLLLRVHPSNFQIVGFTERPELEELVELARRHRLPLAEDLGSGLISDQGHAFLGNEPTVGQSLDAGVDLVCFSGDKLLGATQAGIILGKPERIQQIRSNPLMRALRVDKTGYAILTHSLCQYLRGGVEDLPTHHFLALTARQIRQRCAGLLDLLQNKDATEVRESFSLVGGGSAPDARIPTFVLAVTTPGAGAEDLHRFLRAQDPPIVARIEEDRVVFDLRTVAAADDALIASVLNRFFASSSGRA